MKISGNNGANINFIEQRSVTLKSAISKDTSNVQSISDRFEKTQISFTNFTQNNAALGVMQMAQSSLDALKEGARNLKQLHEKSTLFPEQKSDFQDTFEMQNESLLDIIDNTLFNEMQLFYTPFEFEVGSQKYDFALRSDFGIEGLSIDEIDGINELEENLEQMQEGLSTLQRLVEVASFNELASMKDAQSLKVAQQLTLEKQEKVSPNKEELTRAHDTQGLKEKLLILLGD